MGKLENIQQAVTNNTVLLDNKLVDLPSFERLLSFLNVDGILVKEVEIAPIKGGVSVFGKTAVGKLQFSDSECCIYENKESENGFICEWYGNLDKLQLGSLNLPGSTNLVQFLPSSLLNSAFEDITQTYKSGQETFVLQCFTSNHHIDFPLVQLSFKDLGLYLEWDVPSKQLLHCILTASLQVGKTLIVAELNVPVRKDQSLWTVTLNEEFELENGISDLAAFLAKQELLAPLFGDGKMEGIVPEQLRNLSKLSISAFEMQFDPLKPAIYSISGTVNYNQDWRILDKFTLQDIGLRVFVSFHGRNVASTLTLFGSFSFIENWFVNFSFVLPTDKKSDWLIQLDGYADIENLSQLESLGLFKLESLNIPKEWLMVNGIRLHKLEIAFNPLQGGFVKSVALTVEMVAESQLIPGIKLRNPELDLNISFDKKA